MNFNIKPILQCALFEEGMKLEKVMGSKTNSLNPRKTYVPWILVNGVREKNKNKKQHQINLKTDSLIGTCARQFTYLKKFFPRSRF